MGLLDFFSGKPAPAQPSGGLLGGGTTQAYRDHVVDMQSQGKEPLKYEDWLKQQKAPPPKP